MKRFLLCATLAIFTCTLIGFAQDGAKPATAAKPAAAGADKTDKTTDKKADPAAKKGRLPAQYGKIGVSDAQKEKIYDIQNTYADKIDALEVQITALKAKRDQEIEAILTDDQRKVLKTLNEAAKSKKDDGTKEEADKSK